MRPALLYVTAYAAAVFGSMLWAVLTHPNKDRRVHRRRLGLCVAIFVLPFVWGTLEIWGVTGTSFTLPNSKALDSGGDDN